MGVSTLTHNGHVSTSDPALECLDKEVLMENSLSMADVLAVSRASHNASSKDGMACFTSQLTLSHIEVHLWRFTLCALFAFDAISMLIQLLYCARNVSRRLLHLVALMKQGCGSPSGLLFVVE